MSSSIFQIAGSALLAQSQRMNITASNLANANSVTGPDGQPYRALQAVFKVRPIDNSRGYPVAGVELAEVTESSAPTKLQYDPSNPMANAEGYVEMPNVNVVAETVNMIAASRSYQANIEVINTTKSLMTRTLSIGQ